jgi:hypothetical protein
MEPEYTPMVGTFHPRTQPLSQLQDRLLPIGPRLPSVEELAGGYQVPGVTLPQQPADFYPPNMPTPQSTAVKSQTPQKGTLMYSWANGGKAYSFALGPEQLGGENWVEDVPLRMAIWMRDWLVKFAIDVAGVCGAKNPDELMLDPTYGLKDVLNTAAPKPMQLPIHGGNEAMPVLDNNGVPVYMMRPGVAPGTGFETHGFTEAMKTLEKLAKEVLHYGNSTDVFRVYDYLNQRQAARDKAVVKWMTLPQNLGRVFLTPEMSSAVQICLSDIATYTQTTDNGQLLGDLIASQAYTRFFEMVGTRILIARYDRRGGDKTRHEAARLEQRYLQRLSEIQEMGIVLTAPPVPPDRDLSVQAMQGQMGNSAMQYDALGRPIISLN